MNKKIIKEDSYKNFEIINEWINNSDNKTAIVLGMIGIFLTIIFSNGNIINNLFKIVREISMDIKFDDILYIIIFILLICFCIYGLYCLIKVLIPTLKMKFKNTKSFIYFGSVCKYSNFKEYKEDLLNTNEDDILDDLLNQIYLNSIICNQKFVNFTKGLKSFLVGFIGTIIMYIVGIFIYL